MLNFYTTIGPVTLQTYTLLLGLGVVASMAWTVYALAERPGPVVDALLLGLVGGVAAGRVGHVLLNWAHFAHAPDEIIRVSSGGLDWHGAVIGALAGLYAGARWRGLRLSRLLDALAVGLPLLALSGWLGCWAAGCAFGTEVDTLANHPAWAVWCAGGAAAAGAGGADHRARLAGRAAAVAAAGPAGSLHVRPGFCACGLRANPGRAACRPVA
jgi:prolipoprotein diacylglyceryltransferase